MSRFFLPNIVNLIKKRTEYIDGIKKKTTDKKEEIENIREKHSILISSKNEEISLLIRKATKQAEEIRLDGNNSIQRSLDSLNQEMKSNLRNNLNVEKNNLESECLEILKIISRKIGATINTSELDSEISGVFEKLWYEKINKLEN